MYVKVKYGTGFLEGLLIQEKPQYIVKLDSGYNIVLDRKLVKDVQELKKESKPTKLAKPAKARSGKKITVLHTGGTIASKVDYSTGAVIAQFNPEEFLDLYPEIEGDVSSRLIRNMQSEMMRFQHYNILGKAVFEEVKKGAQAIIITHGTDTMHYTSAALSFMLENVPVPVLLVGSQRSSDRPSSDAAMNILCAIAFISQTSWNGVGVCMHRSTNDDVCYVLPGTKVRKMHTTRRDAFKPVNAEPIATIDYDTKKIDVFANSAAQGDFVLRPFNEKLKIGLLKTHTHMFAEQFSAFKNFDGLIIEGTGLGHIPNQKVDEFTGENDKIFSALKSLLKKMPVAFASQCIYGRAMMDVYTPSRMLVDAGVLGSELDMTAETAFIKMAWVLSNFKDFRSAYTKNFRGEISERSQGDHYY